MKNNNKVGETAPSDVNASNASILVHIIRHFSPTNFWEPESKRFQAEENYRKVIASLTDKQIELLIQNKSRWPEFQCKRKIIRYEDKIQQLVKLYPNLERARREAAGLTSKDLDGWIPYDVSSDGEVLARKYLPDGLHVSRGFDPIGPWEKISTAMRLSKEFKELTEWLPEVVLEEFKSRLDHNETSAER
jgi:hypothetical protein